MGVQHCHDFLAQYSASDGNPQRCMRLQIGREVFGSFMQSTLNKDHVELKVWNVELQDREAAKGAAVSQQ